MWSRSARLRDLVVVLSNVIRDCASRRGTCMLAASIIKLSAVCEMIHYRNRHGQR